MADSAADRRPLLVGLLLAASVLAVYWPVSTYDFVNYDDDVEVASNPYLRDGATARGLRWAFTADLTHDSKHAGHWMPLTYLSHMAVIEVFGMRPGAHHLVNVVLHAAGSLLLFLVLTRMTGDLWPSAFAAALFALHPLHVESVAWVTERHDVLSGLLLMLTLGAYVRFCERPSRRRMAAVCAAFALGLLAKPVLVTLPLLLLLLDYWPLDRLGVSRREILSRAAEKWPLFTLSLVFGMVKLFGHSAEPVAISLREHPLAVRLGSAAEAPFIYLWKLVWPSGLSIMHPHLAESLTFPKAAAAIAALAVLTTLALGRGRRLRFLATGWLWYLIVLAPVSGALSATLSVADRYTYISLIGIFIVIAWGGERLTARLPRRRWILGAAGAASLAAFAAAARMQVGHWRDGTALFSRAAAVHPESPMARVGLGVAHYRAGRDEAAIKELKTAIALFPECAPAHLNLGAVLAKRGENTEAELRFREALRIEPGSVWAHFDLAELLFHSGRADEALARYRKAVDLRPDFVKGHRALGDVLSKAGKFQKASGHYRRALDVGGDDPAVLNGLGAALNALGRQEEAVGYLERAIRLRPDAVRARNNLGIALAGLGRHTEAVAVFRDVLKRDPDNVKAHNNLGNSLYALDRVGEALGHFKEALRLEPDYVDALVNSAAALIVSGRLEEGARRCVRALELSPGNVKARLNLGVAHLQAGHLDSAEREFRAVLKSRPDHAKARAALAAVRRARDAASRK